MGALSLPEDPASREPLGRTLRVRRRHDIAPGPLARFQVLNLDGDALRLGHEAKPLVK